MDILHLYRSNESEAESLINSVQMFTKDIKLDFEIIKCALSNKTKKIGKSDRSEININRINGTSSKSKRLQILRYFRKGWYNAWESKNDTQEGVLLKTENDFVIKIEIKEIF